MILTSTQTHLKVIAKQLPAPSTENITLEYLYDTYAPVLYGLILRIVKDEFIAEEALMKCFTTFREKQLSGTDNLKLPDCLMLIARETAIEKIHTKNYRYQLLAGELLKCRLYLPDCEPVDCKALGKKAAELLPDKLKQVVDLFYFEGKTKQEIAQTMGITEEEVQKALKEAMLLFRSYQQNQ